MKEFWKEIFIFTFTKCKFSIFLLWAFLFTISVIGETPYSIIGLILFTGFYASLIVFFLAAFIKAK